MAKLTLLELTNVEQIFGKSYYAMFLAETEDKQIVEVGLSHNMMTRQGYDKDNPESIVGCTVRTKAFTDRDSGEIINPEDRIAMVINGEGRVVLLNAINANILSSELYKEQKKELTAAIAAKVKVEFTREKRLTDLERSRERLLAKALANLQPKAEETKVPSTLEEVAEEETQEDNTLEMSQEEAEEKF